jgi:hypothetical protein
MILKNWYQIPFCQLLKKSKKSRTLKSNFFYWVRGKSLSECGFYFKLWLDFWLSNQRRFCFIHFSLCLMEFQFIFISCVVEHVKSLIKFVFQKAKAEKNHIDIDSESSSGKKNMLFNLLVLFSSSVPYTTCFIFIVFIAFIFFCCAFIWITIHLSWMENKWWDYSLLAKLSFIVIKIYGTLSITFDNESLA